MKTIIPQSYKKHTAGIGVTLITLATLLLVLHQCLSIKSNIPLVASLIIYTIGIATIIQKMKKESRY